MNKMLLTDNEISDIYEQPSKTPREFARSIEQAVIAKLREQNEPVAWLFDKYEVLMPEEVEKPTKLEMPELYEPLYLHPAPIPEDWQLVPIEPTEVMLKSLLYASDLQGGYKKMLAAARSEE